MTRYTVSGKPAKDYAAALALHRRTGGLIIDHWAFPVGKGRRR